MKFAGLLAILNFSIAFVASQPTYYAPYALMQNVITPQGIDVDGHFVDEIPEDEISAVEEDSEIPVPYLLEMLSKQSKIRARRQVAVDVNRDTRSGTSVSASAQGNLWNNGPHSVDGNAHWSRTYGGPQGTSHPAYGGGLSYSHSDRASVGVDVSRQRPFGTQVSAQAQGTLWRSNDRRTSVGANAGWSRSYGGAWGTSRPNYGGMINLNHRF